MIDRVLVFTMEVTFPLFLFAVVYGAIGYGLYAAGAAVVRSIVRGIRGFK
jgi:hypothetical protein